MLTEMLCMHNSLHIPAQKQLLTIKAFVCLCFVVLTKRKGPFITMNGGRHHEFLPYCTLAYSATFSVPGFWISDGGDLWFMIYDTLESENKPVLHV